MQSTTLVIHKEPTQSLATTIRPLLCVWYIFFSSFSLYSLSNCCLFRLIFQCTRRTYHTWFTNVKRKINICFECVCLRDMANEKKMRVKEKGRAHLSVRIHLHTRSTCSAHNPEYQCKNKVQTQTHRTENERKCEAKNSNSNKAPPNLYTLNYGEMKTHTETNTNTHTLTRTNVYSMFWQHRDRGKK